MQLFTIKLKLYGINYDYHMFVDASMLLNSDQDRLANILMSTHMQGPTNKAPLDYDAICEAHCSTCSSRCTTAFLRAPTTRNVNHNHEIRSGALGALQVTRVKFD